MIYITIKRILVFASILLGIMIVSLITSIVLANRSEEQIKEAQQIRYISLLLAQELRESSNSLTEFIQKFVVTGDEIYSKAYMSMIMIRAGRKRRPYDSEFSPGQLISVHDQIEQVNCSEQELILLQKAERLTTELTDVDLEAMNAMRGMFPDVNGVYSIRGEPDRELAISLVFSKEYEARTDIIEETFSLFGEMLSERLDNELVSAQEAYNRSMIVVWIVLCVVVIMCTGFPLMVGYIIVRPILMCDVFAKQVADGKLNTHLDYRSENEIGSLANSLRSMVESLLERIHFEEHARYFDAVISLANAGVIIANRDGLITDWNAGAENILGYEADEIIGKSRRYYMPEDNYAVIDSFEARLKAGESIERMDVVFKNKDGRVVDCSVSYSPIFGVNKIFMGSVSIFHDITGKKMMEMDLVRAISGVREKHGIIMSNIEYASKIQKNLLPEDSVFSQKFKDYAVIWNPRDIVGGDIYWAKNFESGMVLCVCDCTGHGTPGALLTMLVVSAFEAIVGEDNCRDTAGIIWELEKKLVGIFQSHATHESESRLSVLKDGCDLAVMYIDNCGNVTISSGNIHVFVCDGKEVTRIKGQRLYIGEGKLNSRDEIRTVTIPANPNNKYYVASDGLYDQVGEEHERPFGYKTFKQTILENHEKNLSVITEMIWEEFENYQGMQTRRDDVELIAFEP